MVLSTFDSILDVYKRQEIDCTYNGIDLHVLGYGIDYHHEDFESLEKNILNQELKNSKEKIELTNNLGFDVDKEALKKLSSNGVYTDVYKRQCSPDVKSEILVGK